MWISEVKNKKEAKRERGNFVHRRTFETLEEGREWASDLAFRIVDGRFWSDDELVMEHREVK